MSELTFEDTGSGIPLVFLHGIAMDHSAWQPVIDLLSPAYRCVNVDLVGHGGSPHGGAYDVFTQAGAIAELITELGLDRPIVVGHSFGGFTATLLGTMAPLRGVVNVDQELDTGSFKTSIAPFQDRLRGDDFDAAFDEFVATLGPDLVPQERRALASMVPDRDVVLGVWTMIFDTPAADLNAMVEPVLGSYQVPYLAVFGSTISEEERRLLGLIPGAAVEEWEGMGHFVHLVDPQRMADRITTFVESVS